MLKSSLLGFLRQPNLRVLPINLIERVYRDVVLRLLWHSNEYVKRAYHRNQRWSSEQMKGNERGHSVSNE